MEWRAQDPPEKLGEFHRDPEHPERLLPKPCFPHDVLLRTAALSWDGTFLIALDTNGDLMGWDVGTARLRYRIRVQGKEETAQRLTCSPDNRWVALSPRTPPPGLIRILDLATGKEVRRLDRGFSPAFSPEGDIVAASDGRAIRRWAVKSGAELPSLDPGGQELKWVACSPTGSHLAASCEGSDEIALWDLRTRGRKGIRMAQLDGRGAGSVVFSPEHNILAAGNHWGVELWSIDGRNQHQLRIYEEYPRGELRFSENGSRMTALVGQQRLLVWDVWEGSPLFTWATYKTPDGLLEISESGDVAIWIERGGIRLERIPRLLAGPGAGHVVRRVCFDGDNRLITGDDEGSVRVWDPKTQKELKRFAVPLRNIRFFSRDGKWAVFGGGEDSVCIWDLGEGRERAKVGAQPFVHAVALSPDQKTLALGHSDGSISLWDVEGQRERTRIRRDLAQISALAWSGDGKSLAWGDAFGTVAWAEGGSGLDPLQYKSRWNRAIRELSFTKDGRRLQVRDDGGVSWILSGIPGEDPSLLSFEGSDGSPDRRWSASGYLQKRGPAAVGTEFLSNDGSIAVTMTQAGTILIWQAPGAK